MFLLFSVYKQSVLWRAAEETVSAVRINTRAQFSGLPISKDNNFLKKERSQTSYSEANFRATAQHPSS